MQAAEEFFERRRVFSLVSADAVIIRVWLDVKNGQRFGHVTDVVAERRDIHRVPVAAEFQFGDELADLHKRGSFHDDAVGGNEEPAALFHRHQLLGREITWRFGYADAPMPVQPGGGLTVIADGAAESGLRMLA